MSIDDLLAGQVLASRTCPHCGRLPEDFVDEGKLIEDQSREAMLAK